MHTLRALNCSNDFLKETLLNLITPIHVTVSEIIFHKGSRTQTYLFTCVSILKCT